MSMTDPIADMFTRIRNAQAIGQADGEDAGVQASRWPSPSVLKDEGYIFDAQVSSAAGKPSSKSR